MITWSRFKSTRNKSQGMVVPAFKNAGEKLSNKDLLKEAEKLDNCGYYVKLLECKNCGEDYFRGFTKCKSKYCPTCSAIKGAIWCAKLYPIIEQWLAQGKYVCFATFTIKDQVNLEYMLDVINKAWRYMTNKLVPKEWKKRFAGGVKSIEVKIGKNSGLWHVHIHALILRSHYGRDHHFLREAWAKAVKKFMGEDVPVNMPRIESIKNKANNQKDKNHIIGAICETIKYITKINTNMTAEQIEECYRILKNKRQISCWGNLYGISKKVEKEMDEESDNLIERFECIKCGCNLSEFIEIYDTTGDNWQSSEYLNYEEATTFKPIQEIINNNLEYKYEEND